MFHRRAILTAVFPILILLGLLSLFISCGGGNSGSSGDDDAGSDDDNGPGDQGNAPTPTDAIGVFVASSGNDANPGTMASPVKTIGAAAAIAQAAGKSVFAAKGEYDESVTASVSLYGGYDESDWSRDIAGNLTKIVGSGDAALSIATEGVSVEGFTVANNGGACGAALTASATLVTNVITGGSAAVSCGVKTDAAAILINNVIDGGSGAESRGFWVTAAATAESKAVNNDIGGGAGTTMSYGVYVEAGGVVTLVNNTIMAGKKDVTPYAILSNDGAQVSVVNNALWGVSIFGLLTARDGLYQTDGINQVNNCAWPGCVAADANIAANPKFIDWAGGNFHLQPASPCIDAGTDPSLYYQGNLAKKDAEGNARPTGAGWDIGAYEYQSSK